jgi:hypothetical protein
VTVVGVIMATPVGAQQWPRERCSPRADAAAAAFDRHGSGVPAILTKLMRSRGCAMAEAPPGRWHRGLVKVYDSANVGQFFHTVPAQAHSLAGHGYALAFHMHGLAAGGAAGVGRLGGGGFGRAIVHLFIWHLIWRAGLSLWHIPDVGPFVVLLLIAAIVALVIVRKRRGPRWWNNRGGSTGAGTGWGPRDW